MKKNTILLIQILLALISVAILILLIKLPLTEGRAKNLNLIQVYSDPFILYGYLCAGIFFGGIFQVYQLLGFVQENQVNHMNAIGALKRIRYTAILFSILIILAGLYIRLFHAKEDDPAGFLAICFVSTLFALVIESAARRYQKYLQKSSEINTSN